MQVFGVAKDCSQQNQAVVNVSYSGTLEPTDDGNEGLAHFEQAVYNRRGAVERQRDTLVQGTGDGTDHLIGKEVRGRKK